MRDFQFKLLLNPWLAATSNILNACFRSPASTQAAGVHQPIWRKEERQTDLPLTGCPFV